MLEADLRAGGGVRRGQSVRIRVDDREVLAYDGESLAAALFAAGTRAFRYTLRGAPRGYFCGMGVCHDCVITVDGLPNVRACMTPVRDGLRVQIQRGSGEWGSEP
jgi:predicted molibdopterin-dependent oxidoreductase YjgC